MCGTENHTQLLYYDNLSFICIRCHRVGHFHEDLSLSKFKNKWVPKHKAGRHEAIVTQARKGGNLEPLEPMVKPLGYTINVLVVK